MPAVRRREGVRWEGPFSFLCVLSIPEVKFHRTVVYLKRLPRVKPLCCLFLPCSHVPSPPKLTEGNPSTGNFVFLYVKNEAEGLCLSLSIVIFCLFIFLFF